LSLSGKSMENGYLDAFVAKKKGFKVTFKAL
jgi:hypothetical protein